MKHLSGFIKQLGLLSFVLIWAFTISAQTKPARVSHSLKHFMFEASQANVTFSLPDDFKGLPLTSPHPAFDYGITIPGNKFEIWFSIIPQTEADPDSIYIDIGRTHAKELGGENEYFTRNIPAQVLSEYNADAGKTYLINLPDTPVTRHYKYALLITLQKNHTGTIIAAAFTNDKGPDFFKNINRARNCIKFKP